MALGLLRTIEHAAPLRLQRPHLRSRLRPQRLHLCLHLRLQRLRLRLQRLQLRLQRLGLRCRLRRHRLRRQLLRLSHDACPQRLVPLRHRLAQPPAQRRRLRLASLRPLALPAQHRMRLLQCLRHLPQL